MISSIGEYISCPLCSNRNFLVLYHVFNREFGSDKIFKIVKCLNCKLAYLNPRVKKDLIRSYYPKGYYKVGISDKEAILTTPYETEKLYFIKNFKITESKEKALLDVGCNKGQFLENLKNLGRRNLKGVEFDKDSASFAKKEYNLDIFIGEFEDYPIGEMFDIITFWHTLEHFYDINGVVAKAAKLLKENGIIIISVPDIKSIQAKAMGKYWYHLDMPRHAVHFTKATLERLLRQHNFIIVDYSYKYPSHNFDGWYSSIMNIYNHLRQKASTKEIYPRKEKRISKAKFIILKAVEKACRLLSRIEMASGGGGVITVCAKRYARKDI